MTIESGPSFFYPNRMGRIILSATEEVIGGEAAHRVLEHAALPELAGGFPPDDLALKVSFDSISKLQCALDELYGQGGRGLAQRIGRACFQEGLQEFGPSAGLTALGFRLLPLSTKLKAGASALAAIFNQHTDQRVRVDEDGERLYWRIERCPVCWERRTTVSCCHLATGLLEEALYWVSNGRQFNVEEIACVACGDPACVIAIDKTPLS
jgi:predicted hydrocarbon binding protein